MVAWYSGFLEKSADGAYKLTLTIADNGRTFINVTYAQYWVGWVEQVTAIPSQEYDVPLASGISNLVKSTYSKDQFGIVRVNISVQAENLSGMNIRIGTLPVGFRPAVSRVVVPGFLRTSAIESGYQANVCALVVYNDGSIFCDTYQYSGVVAQGQLRFFADS